MTPEQELKKLFLCLRLVADEPVAADIEAKILEALANEREACKKIVEEHNCDGAHTGCCGTDLGMLDDIRKRANSQK